MASKTWMKFSISLSLYSNLGRVRFPLIDPAKCRLHTCRALGKD